MSQPPDGRERRKLPDPATPRLLALWAVVLPLLLWTAHRFFQARFFTQQSGGWAITPLGGFAVFAAAAALAALLAMVFYKFKFGRFHWLSVLRVVRGILTLFLLTVIAFWPISMMVVALNPAYTGCFIVMNAAGVLLLTVVIRLSAPPESGFWRDWLYDMLLRW